MLHIFLKRQYYGDDGDDNYNWDYSSTAIAIKWAFIGAILLFFLLWFIGGYYHAQQRMKRGEPPLLYHRFLVSRGQRMRYPRPQYGYYPQQHEYYGQGYPMQTYAPPPPPPAYHAEHLPPPPAYQPPEGGSKVNPTQDWAIPPPGPPPGRADAGESSTANQSIPLGQGPARHHHVAGEPTVQEKKPGRFSRFNPFK